MLKIDSHHHLWEFSALDYGWISESMGVLRHNFLPPDLYKEMTAVGISSSIAVQARQTLEETHWLLNLAEHNDFIKAVVGWVPLTDPNVCAFLEQVAEHPRLRAVRHVIQDEPDDTYILRADFNRGVKELARHKLTYDILVFERHLPQTIRFVDQHPNQKFVVDHLAKPRVKDGSFSPWREQISELAKRPNVYCKISGLATEADHNHWTEDQLRPYIDTVLNAFTPKRVMFGSDWPVCLLALPYKHWATVVEKIIAAFSLAEQQQFWAKTATEAYNL